MVKAKPQITYHSRSSNSFSSKPTPGCHVSSVSHRLRRCQASSSSVVPSPTPTPATSAPTPPFSFHLRRPLSVNFHFFHPHPILKPSLFSSHSTPFPHFSLSSKLPQLPTHGRPFFFWEIQTSNPSLTRASSSYPLFHLLRLCHR